MTDAKGEYTAPSVPTGTYTVAAEMQGFKTSTTGSGPAVAAAAMLRVDARG